MDRGSIANRILFFVAMSNAFIPDDPRMHDSHAVEGPPWGPGTAFSTRDEWEYVTNERNKLLNPVDNASLDNYGGISIGGSDVSTGTGIIEQDLNRNGIPDVLEKKKRHKRNKFSRKQHVRGKK